MSVRSPVWHPRSMSDLAEEILAKRFTTTRFRAGYAVDEVDLFLDRAVVAVRGGDDLTPLVDGALFRTVTLAESYDVDEVDDFLEELKARRPAAGSGPTPPATRRPDSSTVPEPTLSTSTGGLRRWLFGRR